MQKLIPIAEQIAAILMSGARRLPSASRPLAA